MRSLVPVVVLGLLFLISAYVAQTYEAYFIALLSDESWIGILAYTGIAFTTTVVAPLTSIPLMPIASSVWGPVVAAVASIVGWLIASMIAFFLSRTYGRALVEKVISNEKILSIERRVPEKNIFWSIVLLRMAVPADVLSYVLGLFTAISWRTYFFATLIGITPFAFVFAYTGTLPLVYQIPILLVGLAAISLLLRKRT